MKLAESLAAGRIAIGAASWIAPRRVGKLFGMRGDDGETAYMARLFGSRDIALGAGVLSTQGEARRKWLTLGVMCDALDAGAGALGGRTRDLRGGTAVLLTAVAVGAAVQGIAALSNGG